MVLICYVYIIYTRFIDHDMAGRHRCRAGSIQIIRTGIVADADTKRPYVQQFHARDLKFPLPHRILRAPSKQFKSTFSAMKPNTHFD